MNTRNKIYERKERKGVEMNGKKISEKGNLRQLIEYERKNGRKEGNKKKGKNGVREE